MKILQSLFIKCLFLVNLAFVITQAMGMENFMDEESDARTIKFDLLKKLRTNPEIFNYQDMRSLIAIIGSGICICPHKDKDNPETQEYLFEGTFMDDDFVYKLYSGTELTALLVDTDSKLKNTDLPMTFKLEKGPTSVLLATHLTYKLTTGTYTIGDTEFFILITYATKSDMKTLTNSPLINKLQRRRSQGPIQRLIAKSRSKPEGFYDDQLKSKEKDAISVEFAEAAKPILEEPYLNFHYINLDINATKMSRNGEMRPYAVKKSIYKSNASLKKPTSSSEDISPTGSEDISTSTADSDIPSSNTLAELVRETSQSHSYDAFLNSRRHSDGQLSVTRVRTHSRQVAAILDFTGSSSASESSSSSSAPSSSSNLSKQIEPDA